MNYTPAELKDFCEKNPKLVSIKQSIRYPELRVIKYARKVFYNSLWNQYPILKELRGLVVDDDYNVIVKPFTKIMNYLEDGAGSTLTNESIVYRTRKVNGFMASVSSYKGELLISTTGSLDSDFCSYAWEYLGDIDPEMIFPGETLMFEICHPLDPHIVQEKPGAYFLATTYNGDEYYSWSLANGQMMLHLETCGIDVSEWYNPLDPLPFKEAKEIADNAPHEGFVFEVRGTGERFKIKSKAYTIKKMLARKQDILTLNKERIPEEYYPMVDFFKNNEEFKAAEEQGRLRMMEDWIDLYHNKV